MSPRKIAAKTKPDDKMVLQQLVDLQLEMVDRLAALERTFMATLADLKQALSDLAAAVAALKPLVMTQADLDTTTQQVQAAATAVQAFNAQTP